MTAGVILILVAYFLVTLLLGIAGYRATARTAEGYFLASRTIGSLVFFLTMIATLFSGFAIFGVSGLAYRSGLAAYEFSFFGNCFAPLMFYLVGYRVWRIGKRRGYVTPTEFFGDRFGNAGLNLLILAIWIVFSAPFLAVQWTAAGFALAGLTDGAVSFQAGVILLTLFTMGYVFIGGMKSVAWTDSFQGMVMLAAFLLCSYAIVQGMGGLGTALGQLQAEYPQHFSRPGTDGEITRGWALSMLLIGPSAFMAPQLFARFYVPRSPRQFRMAMASWIPVIIILGVPVVLVGALGRLEVPGLTGREADEIFSLMLREHASPWLQALFTAGIMAAMMSTASSILLVLSSFVSRDLYLRYVNREASETSQVLTGRVSVLLIGAASCVLALRTDSTLFGLLVYAFSAFAMLLPTTVAALYWKRANAWGCMSGIAAGVTLLLATGTVIPDDWTGSLPVVVPAFVVNALLVVGVSYLTASADDVRAGERFLRAARELL